MTSHATGDGGIPPRDAAERGLKRIMTLGGVYGTRNYTVKHLRDQKGKRVLVGNPALLPRRGGSSRGSRDRHHEGAVRPPAPRARGGYPAGRSQHVHGLLGPAARRRHGGGGGAPRLRRDGGRGGRDHVPVESALHRRGDRGGRPRAGTRGPGAAPEHLDRGAAGGRQDP